MKKFILGFIIGIIISLSITAFANVKRLDTNETVIKSADGTTESELNIVPNPFPILIDGVKSEISGYNINGSSYFKLRDYEKAGLTVDFKDNTILIKTNKSTQTTNSEEVNTVNGTKNTVLTTPDGIEVTRQKDGLNYITWLAFNNKYKSQGIELKSSFYSEINPQKWSLYKNDELLLDNVEFHLIDAFDCIEYNYYVNTILPLVE